MPLLKNVLFALGAAVLTVAFVWYLVLPLHRAVTGLGSIAFWVIMVVGMPLLLAGFVFGMLKLGRDAGRWGFGAYTPTFLFVTAFFAMRILAWRSWRACLPWCISFIQEFCGGR